MKLNLYIANAGICSRRKATQIIKEGKVTVNHFPVTEPGYEVREKDTVRIGKMVIKPEHKVYILFNEPPECVTTTSDELGRSNIMDFIKLKERVYPVGRLDYDTSGLLLLTNDGQLAQKLAHPKFEVQKIYHIVLDKPLMHKDLVGLKKGMSIDNQKIIVDAIAYAGKSKKGLVITIHSGKYRVIRRLFELLGYSIVKLDRVGYAGLTKKGLSQQGKWRYLKQKEIDRLKGDRPS